MSRRAVLYARISVVTDESVSVARQLASGRQYAAARGWEVVGEYTDNGVSASRVRPADREGWQELLRSARPFDAVVIWKVDRLARRVLDFLQVDEELQRRGAAIACVEQSLDLTTSEGRAFAQMLAVFGELEVAATSERQAAARAHLIAQGRHPGGRMTYGFQIIRNPDGPGKVRSQDPLRAPWVRAMADRALDGANVNSIRRWLQSSQAPAPYSFRGPVHTWSYSSVNRLLMNPVLAGMYPCNPGLPGGQPWTGVRRDGAGKPVIGPDAIITVEEHEALKRTLTHKNHPAAISSKLRKQSSTLLAGLVNCAECGRRMTRGLYGGAPSFICPDCLVSVRRQPLVRHIVSRLLLDRGQLPTFRRVWTVPDDPATSRKLATVDAEMRSLALSLTRDGVEPHGVAAAMTELKRTRQGLRGRAGEKPVEELVPTGVMLEKLWRCCATDEQRHEILAAQIDTLKISRLERPLGGSYYSGRTRLTWVATPLTVVPDGVLLDASQVAPADSPLPWISRDTAASLLNVSVDTIRQAVKRGEIEQRKVDRSYPSLSRVSVIEFGCKR